MIPILYEGTETSFTSNGIGRLSDAISCTVTENRNGAYELEMEYPIDGVHFSDISLGKYIFAKPAKYSNKQAFEIYQITRPINGVCTIYAYHISYRLSKIPVMPFSTNSVTAALSGLVTNAAETNPFTFTTTKTTVANYNQTEPRDARSCLGGVQGSILDVFGGGDYEFDMFNVKLWQNRGQDRGFQIRYGKNLTDIKQEESIEDTITGIVPFYKNESTTITLPEKVISTASASNFPYPRTIPVDLSSEFQDSVPTVTQLRNAGNAYIASHSIGVPKVSLDVSFVNLADMVGYEDIAILEDVRLCDTVTVIFEKLGVSASAKVISTEWDVLKDKFNKVGLGSASNSLANKIANIEKVQTESSSFLEDAIQRATNLITGESGGYVVIHNNSDGKPYEILIMDNEDIEQAVHVWRWNQAGWGYSSTGYNGTYSLAATLDGGIVADFIKAGTITGIEINNGNGTFKVDSSGNLSATSATISGTITGSTISGGTITGSTITSSSGLLGTITISLGGITCSGQLFGDVTIENGIVIAKDRNSNKEGALYNGSLGIYENGVSSSSGARFEAFCTSIGLWKDYIDALFHVSSSQFAYWNTNGNATFYSNLTVSGTKSRRVSTKDYGERLLYCQESPSPIFTDIGEGETDSTGTCEIWIDDIFGETIDETVNYQVFLQKYGEGDLWVEERTPYMFKVKGSKNLKFGWELKAIQRDYDTMRLEEVEEIEEQEDILGELLNEITKGEDNE